MNDKTSVLNMLLRITIQDVVKVNRSGPTTNDNSTCQINGNVNMFNICLM